MKTYVCMQQAVRATAVLPRYKFNDSKPMAPVSMDINKMTPLLNSLKIQTIIKKSTMQDHRKKPLRRWVNGGLVQSYWITDSSKISFWAEQNPQNQSQLKKQTVPPAELCTPAMSRSSWAGQGCWCRPPLAEYNLSASLQALHKLGLASSLLHCLPSGAQGNAARFAPWETASVPAAWRWWKADGTSTLHVEWAAWLAFSRGTVLPPAPRMCLRSSADTWPLGTTTHRNKEKSDRHSQTREKKFQNLLWAYFGWVLCPLALHSHW